MAVIDRIREEVEKLKEEVVDIRRDFHKYPELGFEELRTSAIVANYLEELGLDVKQGIAGTGVVGVLRGSGSNRTVLLRADMDALPIEELSDIPYRSQNPGKMHACGHDGHTAILMCTAKVLSRLSDELKGTIKFVFQPSEEKDPGGAIKMIESGVLENPKVDFAYGLHLGTIFDTGKIVIRSGVFMAEADRFIVKVKGKGSHGAYPHMSVDPIVIASNIVLALQTIVSRETDPLDSVVVSVGKISSGDVFNVIPETAYIEGTVRTLRREKAQQVKQSIQRIVQDISLAYGGESELEYNFGYPPLCNDAFEVDFVKGVASEIFGDESVLEAPISMGGEDMSYFLERVPGAFFWLGAGNKDKNRNYPHHSPYFDIDEEALPLGIQILSYLALKSAEK